MNELMLLEERHSVSRRKSQNTMQRHALLILDHENHPSPCAIAKQRIRQHGLRRAREEQVLAQVVSSPCRFTE